jgi:cytochrome b
VLALLLFRLGWFLWGGRHSRWPAYAVTARRLLDQLHGRSDAAAAHTAFGALLLLGLWTLVAVQAVSGLFASDDIFTEGPLAHRLDDDGVDFATALHTRVFWPIIALIAGHVTAIAWYGLARRDRLARAMFDGRKAGPDAEPRHRALVALATAAASAAFVYALVAWG